MGRFFLPGLWPNPWPRHMSVRVKHLEKYPWTNKHKAKKNYKTLPVQNQKSTIQIREAGVYAELRQQSPQAV